ncbi:MAG: cation-translocating P-type ATPase [Anaerolineaceae bacterium]|nr:MAG: cation-translocating P-type ATPase [Anaerolineaceae bacterium]
MAILQAQKQKVVPESNDWHIRDADEICAELNVAPASGLRADEIEARRATYGRNELEEKDIESPWAMLWEQLTDPMVVILIGAAIISAFLGDVKSVVAITAIVVLNAILGVSQEYRAEKAMAELRKMAASMVRVRRDGRETEKAPVELVPGDIVLLNVGSVIPADARVIHSANLQVQEASLTGESHPVEKHRQPLKNAEIALADRQNMVYMGTAVTYGRGEAVIVATGMRTELGRIADLIQSVGHEKTPLQRRMAQLGKALFYVGLGIVGVAFAIGLFVGLSLNIAFLTAVAIAVAVVPEGLPAVVTISLALGGQRMLNRRALIRKLPAVETLGSVTVICSDKTGTLTQNRMTVKMLDVAGYSHDLTDIIGRGKRALSLETKDLSRPERIEGILLMGCVLNNDSNIRRDEKGDVVALGDPTESALLVAGAQFGLRKDRIEPAFPRIGEVPFTSARKRMTTVHRVDHEAAAKLSSSVAVDALESALSRYDADYIAFTKGGVDGLLDVCTAVWVQGEAVPLTEERIAEITAHNDQMASEGLRVLGMAFRPFVDLPADADNETTMERDLIFCGMIGMIDPPRPEVKEAVARCRRAGIRPIMITGDHPLTAQAIARELDISRDEPDGTPARVMTGAKLNRMSDAEIAEAVKTVNVFARVSPEHKLNIVTALQAQGHIVAMTGDGVNDAPALKRADIGVAMGISGTPVTKEASDMVILDDNFANIVSAAEEGRTIYDNVRKFIKYILASNTGEVLVLFILQLAGLPLPLNTIQILWMNLVTDGLPALALGVEKGEPNAMNRPPHDPQEGIFARGLGAYLIRIGILIMAVTFIVAFIVPAPEGEDARNTVWGTMIFTTLVMSQMGHALAIRSERESAFKIGLFTNKAMLASIALTTVLQIAVIYTPFAQEFFYTVPLSAAELALCFGLATLTFFGVEFDKWFFNRRKGGSLARNNGS